MAYIIRRLEFLVITLWAAVTINFLLPRLMPGNPAQAVMSRIRGPVNPEIRHTMEVAFGLDTHQSILAQYGQYLGDIAQGKFGVSISNFPTPVSQVILVALPWTLGLIGITTIISFVLGTFAGMVSAWRRGRLADNVLPPVFIVMSALPYFWLGLLSIFVFSVSLRWFPLGFGSDVGSSGALSWSYVGQVVSHAALPAITIVVTSIGGWILTMRNNMIATLSEDYVKMARAKGLSPLRIMVQYAGRNAVLPNITGFAMSLGFVLSGALLTEIVFNYPGLGFVLYQAVTGEDYPLMQAIFLIITVAVLLAIVAADLVNIWLDPRTRGRG